jgi:hypothetical protein
MTTKLPLQKIMNGILHTEDEKTIAIKEWEVLNLKSRADK